MKAVFIVLALFTCLAGFSQIELDYYDLPKRGESYLRNSVFTLPSSAIPESVLDESKQEFEWDLSEITNEYEVDTTHFYWIEGTSGVFDFPDANMVDFDINADEPASFNYFIKKPDGFWLSGTSGGFETDLGTFDIKAEFRPAVPIMKVPANVGDEVSETSRATVSVATFGNVRLTTITDYKINGFGTLKIPGDDETYEVLRVKRVTDNEVEIDIDIFGQKIDTVTKTQETAYEFYTKKYGDNLASVSVTEGEEAGVEQWSFGYKKSRVVSSIPNQKQGFGLGIIQLPSANALILISESMVGGKYNLVDMEGKLVKSWTAHTTKELVNTSQLQPGVYLVRATNTNGNSEFKKFVVQ